MRHDGSISVNLPKVVTDCEFWRNAKSVELDFSEEKNIIIIKPIGENKNE